MPTVKRDDVADAIRAIFIFDDDYLEVVWGIDDFNRKFEVKPNPELYANLVCEEVNEWMEELLMNGYTPNLLKETIDVVYVLEGLLAANPDDDLDIRDKTNERLECAIDTIHEVIACIVHGLYNRGTLKRGFEEVQRSNLSKLGEDGKPIRREDGKVLKGPNYSPADMTPFVWDKADFVQMTKI